MSQPSASNDSLNRPDRHLIASRQKPRMLATGKIGTDTVITCRSDCSGRLPLLCDIRPFAAPVAAHFGFDQTERRPIWYPQVSPHAIEKIGDEICEEVAITSLWRNRPFAGLPCAVFRAQRLVRVVLFHFDPR